MRDHRKLRAFELADTLAVEIYQATVEFPKAEQFGLMAQMRRASVSVASNIVEGCVRQTEGDYLRFLDIAYGSAMEVGYQLSLARRLGFLDEHAYDNVRALCEETSRVLNGLIQSLRRQPLP